MKAYSQQTKEINTTTGKLQMMILLVLSMATYTDPKVAKLLNMLTKTKVDHTHIATSHKVDHTHIATSHKVDHTHIATSHKVDHTHIVYSDNVDHTHCYF